ncbi:MAG: SdpI family protein [[Bacteroides] pectinophilus]|nr:SdpI family protein [[Bacteroides] pectinophilus]
MICDCTIPLLMIIAGRMMWKHCPKKINGIVGYRTKMSMINMDTWKFAHEDGTRQ